MSDITPLRLSLQTQPAKQGYVWFRQGVWLFRKNPFGFLVLLFLYLIFVQFAVIIPIIGVTAVLMISPGLMMGFMSASRKVIKGEPIGPFTLLDGFRNQPKTTVKSLLHLGGVYCILMILLSLIVDLAVDLSAFIPVIQQETSLKPEMVQDLYRAMIVGAILYVPVAILMWFSPMLITWHHLPVHKALFFSWLACWRNRAAFISYLIIWGVLLILVPLLLKLFFASVNLGEYSSMLIMPYTMGMMAMLYCSFYATWRGCFSVIDDSHLLAEIV